MALPRLHSTLRALPPSCSLSSLASTSRLTLDHPLPTPAWHELVAPDELRPQQHSAKEGEAGQQGQHRRRRRRNAVLASKPAQAGQPQPPARPPPSDRTQISPTLPLVTRERSFLLSSLRNSLHSHSTVDSPSPSRRRRLPRRKEQAWDTERAWEALARVLKYPTSPLDLPPSVFPSSARAPLDPDAFQDDYEANFSPDATSPSPAPPDSPSFFTSSRPPPSPAPQRRPHPLDPPSPVSPDGRAPLALSVPELRRLFTLFASARPRTQNGLSRLLVVAELLARAKGVQAGQLEQEGWVDGEDGSGSGEGGGGVERLRGGGAGLDPDDWAQLVLFAGASLRTTRPQVEVKAAMGLVGQALAARGRAASTGSVRGKAAEARLYAALAHLANRAGMYELLQQVRGRMRELELDTEAGSDAGVLDALDVGEMVALQRRGGTVEAVWDVFAQAVARAGEASDTAGLWNALLRALSRRGLREDAMRVYEAMRAGQVVDLHSLRPAEADDAPAPPPLPVRPPPLTDKAFTALIQGLAWHGDFAAAVRVLQDIAAPPASSSRTDEPPVSPMPHHFHPLFRALATFGSSSSVSTRGQLDEALLSGKRVRQYALSSSTPSYAALSASLSSFTRSPGSQDASNPFTLATLDSLFTSFLSLSPPPSSLHPHLPFNGHRTAPSSKHLYWVLLAFEKLAPPGEGARLALAAWTAMERKFAGGEVQGKGWTGWRVDRRIEALAMRSECRSELFMTLS
ncbi:hypothetical protein JCM10207_008762 [Rhodosporidiobolus poonsookiae]